MKNTLNNSKKISIIFISIFFISLVVLFNNFFKHTSRYNNISASNEIEDINNSISDKTNYNNISDSDNINYNDSLINKDDLKEQEIYKEVSNINSDKAEIETSPLDNEEIKERNRLSEISKINSSINWNTNINTINMLLPAENYEDRKELTTHIVLHFISDSYNSPTSPYNINNIHSLLKDYGLSTHYVIDRSGQVYLFTPENMVAYHAGSGSLPNFPNYNNKLNHHSIGIEILGVGSKEEMIPIITADRYDLIKKEDLGFTEEEYNSLNMLIDDIISRHPYIKRDRSHIIGHDEYNPSKTDPGSLFDWSKISL